VPSVRANGIEQSYTVVGAGPPLVLLHGATSSGPEDFAAQLPRFGRGFTCYLPDARGHGRTRWDTANGFTTDMLVADVEAFIDVLNLDSFHLMGFSMGGMTALHLAVRRSDRVRSLVVIGTSPERDPRASIARRAMDPERIEREDPALAAELAMRHDPGQGEGAWRRLLPAIAADVVAQPLLSPRDLRSIDAPALVVSGDRDPFCPVDQAWGLARQLHDARLFIVPAGDHDVPATSPSLFNEACATFYRATESGSPRGVRGGEDR
jgi:pimeloyl-ACP methyl ester carboxylesterase